MLKVKLMNLFDIHIYSLMCGLQTTCSPISIFECKFILKHGLYQSLMHKTRPPPLLDSCSLSLSLFLSLSPRIFNSVARIQHTNLFGPSPSLSLYLSLSVCGGVFLVRMHIYSIYRSLSHTMYDSLVQARYLGCTHRTHTNSLAHCP